MKKLFLLMAVCAFAFASCESLFPESNSKPTPENPDDQPEPGPEPEVTTFTITSDTTFEVVAAGEDIIITYDITNPVDDAVVVATPSVEWITESDNESAENALKFAVAENAATEARTATITLKYSDIEHCVTINQAAAEVANQHVELEYISGIYYGNGYCATDDTYNYSIALSNIANCYDLITGDIALVENSTYLFLDLYAATPAENYNITFNVPEGEYTLDLNDTTDPGTVGSTYSYLYITDEYSGVETQFAEGSVIVNSEGIYATFTDAEGTEYRYFCKNVSVDNSANFGPSFAPAEQSTLTGDLNVEFTDGAIYAECYDDYYVVGKYCWLVSVDDYATGSSFSFELLSETGNTLPTGVFPVSNDLNKEQMALPGYVNGDGETMWSWYMLYDGYDVIGSAPIVDGSISIMDNGDETYTISIDVMDDIENKITGECVAFADFYATTQSATRTLRHTLPSRK